MGTFFRNLPILILLFSMGMHCTKKKAGIQDPIWQEESLKIASDICARISECMKSSHSTENLELSKSDLAKSKLQEAACQEKHRKTNVFLLIGTNPDTIKEAARNCHSNIMAFNCEDLRNKKFLTSPACQTMAKIQKGNDLKSE